MRILFYFTFGLIFLLVQTSILNFSSLSYLKLDFLLLLIILIGFRLRISKALILAVLIGLVTEVFSFFDHGMMLMNYVVIVSLIQLLKDEIYTETYLVLSIWTFIISLGYLMVLPIYQLDFLASVFWKRAFIFSLVHSVLSVPIFILVDKCFDLWIGFLSRRRYSIDEADYYQASHKD